MAEDKRWYTIYIIVIVYTVLLIVALWLFFRAFV
jgi:hypothetical protein